MIYLVGGAPRSGKSILGQQVSSKLRIGWISTDILAYMLKAKDDDGAKVEWNAATETIVAKAERFYPYLERFTWGISSMAESYLIEGVELLPSQAMQLSKQYRIRPVFLGCSEMTLERFDRFPGHSRGYATLSEEMRQRIVHDVPLWSEFIRQQAHHFGYPYVDMVDNFPGRLHEAEAILTAGAVPKNGLSHTRE